MKNVLFITLLALNSITLYSMNDNEALSNFLNLLRHSTQGELNALPHDILQLCLLDALNHRDYGYAQRTINAGADINDQTMSRSGQTALHSCASHEKTDSCSFLLDNGANINAQDKKGMTPLFYAAARKRKDICKLLLERGARLDLRCHKKISVLHFAASIHDGIPVDVELNEAKELCELLLNHQQNINNSLITGLLCFKRLENQKHPVGMLFYRQRKTLLIPYLDKNRYISLYRLLNQKTSSGMRPFDVLGLNCLNPENYRKKNRCCNCIIQ